MSSLRRSIATAPFLLSLALCGSAAVRAQGDAAAATAGRVDDARATLAKWVEARMLISKERSDWRLAGDVLHQRLDLANRSIDALRQKIADAERSIAEADTEKQKLATRHQELRSLHEVLKRTVVQLEDHTRQLLRLLPEPVQERVRPLSQLFPADPDDARQSLGARIGNVLAVLNSINKWNREITVTSEVRQLPNGSSAEVTVLYLGLGQAYYVTQKGDAAGIGTIADDGWVWLPADSAAPAIAQAIAIHKGEKEPAFVPVPVRIK